MATAKLNNFSLQQLSQAVGQIVSADKFWLANSHVPVAERARVRQNVIEHRQWPDYPLFSPYAKTHDGYSQSKFTIFFGNPMLTFTVRFLGTKFLVHRVTFRHKHGRQLDDALELSHIVNCGLRTSS
jgi:hypothetical protein